MLGNVDTYITINDSPNPPWFTVFFNDSFTISRFTISFHLRQTWEPLRILKIARWFLFFFYFSSSKFLFWLPVVIQLFDKTNAWSTTVNSPISTINVYFGQLNQPNIVADRLSITTVRGAGVFDLAEVEVFTSNFLILFFIYTTLRMSC